MGTPDAEKMHHSKGAFSETCYIYGSALEEIFEREWPRRILSLGLGLGYNEILTASRFDEVGLLASFEIDSDLERFFVNWVKGETDSVSVPKEFQQVYDQILGLFSQKFNKPKSQILWNLNKWRNEGTWKLMGEFKTEEFSCDDMSAIFFDPFCSKTNSTLWTEDFLNRFFNEVPGQHSVISTYAATGAIKRALRKNDFELLQKPGFAGRRESTFAVKNKGFRWQNPLLD
jgi:hypothetical protein